MTTMLMGTYTDPVTGVSRLVPLAVDVTGKLLTTAAAVAGVSTLRTLNNANLLVSPILQASFQTAYDGAVGNNAPDAVPIEVINAANALADTQYKIYLGHTTWWYTNTASSVLANWTVFGGNKSNFGALVPVNHIFTFK